MFQIALPCALIALIALFCALIPLMSSSQTDIAPSQFRSAATTGIVFNSWISPPQWFKEFVFLLCCLNSITLWLLHHLNLGTLGSLCCSGLRTSCLGHCPGLTFCSLHHPGSRFSSHRLIYMPSHSSGFVPCHSSIPMPWLIYMNKCFLIFQWKYYLGWCCRNFFSGGSRYQCWHEDKI